MMKCPLVTELPPPPAGKTGWPWTEGALESNPGDSLAVTAVSPVGTQRGGVAAGTAATTEKGAEHPDVTGIPPSQWPRISIVIPCFNAGKYIEEAMRSVLLQGYPDVEVILIDGGSTDQTMEIVHRYDRWLSYWVSEKDKGQSHAINKGLEHATGGLFNWFNADDIMCPGALKLLAEPFLWHENAVAVFGAVERFDSEGNTALLIPVTGTREQIGNWAAPVFLPQPGGLFKKESCVRVGRINEKLHYVMDVEFMMRLADEGQFLVVNPVTARFRCHSDSKTQSGDIPGLVELIAAEFNLGMADVAQRLLERRLAGYGGLMIDQMKDEEMAAVVDRWSYLKLFRYLMRRLGRNVLLRLPGAHYKGHK